MTDAPQPSRPSVRLLLPALALVLAGYALAVAAKGPTLDEYWSLFYTDPALRFGTAFHWWSSDTGHPIGFYFLTRILREVLPDSVAAGRLFNLLPLALFAAVAARAAATDRTRAFAALFAITVLGSYTAIERFAEVRAFFWGLMLLATLTVVLAALLDRPRITAKALLAVAALAVGTVCFDYMAFAAANALLCSAGVVLFLRQRRADAARLAAALAAGWIVAALSLWNAMTHPLVPEPYYVDFRQFTVNLIVAGGSGLIGNAVVTMAAATALWRAAKAGAPWRRPGWLDEWGLAVFLALALFAALAGYGLVNAVTHVMVKRQLFSLSVLVCGLVCALADTGGLGPRLRRLVVPCLAVTLAAALAFLWHTPNFRRHAPALAEAQRRCPAFRVFALNYDDLAKLPRSLNRDHAAIALQTGYRSIARDYGFRLAPADAPRTFDPACGGAIWFEQAWFSGLPEAGPFLDRLGFAVPPDRAARATMRHDIGSFLIVVPGEEGPRG